MIRNLKTLGLAFVAVLALSAVAASAASAQQGKLTSDGPVTLTATETGELQNRLTAFGAFVECPGSHYTGHKFNATPHEFIPNEATTFTITPEYTETVAGDENCKGPSGSSATIDLNGCDYVLHLGETTGSQEPDPTYGATFDVVCPAGNTITVTIWLSKTQHTTEPLNPRCVLHVPPQTGLVGAHVTDTQAGDGQVELTGMVEGITVQQTRNSILCPAGTHTEEGKFDLDVAVTGHNEELEPTAISVSHT